MDFEHTPANHLSFRLATRVVLPTAIPTSSVRRFGATSRKIVRFDGYKEQIYVDSLSSELSKGRRALPFNVPAHCVVVIARPPADFAIYHRFENPLFDEWLDLVGNDPNVFVILLPRTADQRIRAQELNLASVMVPDAPIKGNRLMAAADLVVSAGGSMNREAAVLGIPAFSLFAGRIGGVDRELVERGRMELIETRSDLQKIEMVRRPEPVPLRADGLVASLVDDLLATRGVAGRRSISNAA
jgi:predicted glycosyltransferase